MKMTKPQSDREGKGMPPSRAVWHRLFPGVCLALVLGITPGCSLLLVPLKILTSLVTDAIRLAPKAAGLLVVVQDPDARWSESEGSDLSLPLLNMDGDDRALLAGIDRLSVEGAPEMTASELLWQLVGASGQGRAPARIDFLRVTPESAAILSRLTRGDGNRVIYHVRPLPGIQGRDNRVELVTLLQQRGTTVLDWTAGNPSPRFSPSGLAFPGPGNRNLGSP